MSSCSPGGAKRNPGATMEGFPGYASLHPGYTVRALPVGEAQTAEDAEAGTQEAVRVLVVLVEQIVDTGERRDMLVDDVVAGEIDDGVPLLRDRCEGRTIDVLPLADVEHGRRQCQAVGRRPYRGEAGLVAWPAEEFLPGDSVDRLHVGVVRAQLELVSHIDGGERLDTLSLGLADVYEGKAGPWR